MFDMFLLDYFFDFLVRLLNIFYFFFFWWDLFLVVEKVISKSVAYRWFPVSPRCQSSSRNSRLL